MRARILVFVADNYRVSLCQRSCDHLMLAEERSDLFCRDGESPSVITPRPSGRIGRQTERLMIYGRNLRDEPINRSDFDPAVGLASLLLKYTAGCVCVREDE